MVYIHGGAWMIGEKREQGKPMMYELVARGWVCVAINYRLSPKATWPDHIVDAKRAVAWVKEHIDEYGGDPAFVAVSGGSAGGHLCALLALSAGDPAFQPGFEDADTTVQACVPFYGVMDLTELARRFGHLRARPAQDAREERHEDDGIGSIPRSSGPPRRPTGSGPRHPRSSCSRGSTTRWCRSSRPGTFVERLRAVSTPPVAYAELPLAQHAFDVLASLRCQATTSAVADFLEAARAAATPCETSPPPPPRIRSEVESETSS